MRARSLTLIAALLLSGCAVSTSTTPAAVREAPPTEVGHGAASPAAQPALVSSAKGMVSAADPRAAAAGAEMLRQGGSAADAALATLLALTVVEPQSSGIGGGGFLVYDDGDGSPETYDGRETAPAAANETWFFVNGKPLDFPEVIPGGRSVGVPGNVRLMALAHRNQGRLAWAKLFEPAIRLARDGFAVTPRFREMLANNKETAGYTATGRALLYQADGTPKPVGTIIRNPELASFLEQLARKGPDHFYSGQNAAAIASAVSTARTNPAPMTVGDVIAYEAKQRPPVCGEYRGHRICGMGPPSSGGTTVFAILKQLERFPLGQLGPASPQSWHLIADSMRLAFADRNRYLADPDFISVPTTGLFDAGYLAQRSALISPDRALASAEAGTPPGAPRLAEGLTPEVISTSHFVAVDQWGEVASLTSTIESSFGSGLMVNGYYLNNELTDFSLVPNVDSVWVANRVQAGKRPRSSMAPTIVYGPEGKVRLAVGAAGGPTIIAQVAKAIIAMVDWNMTAQQALAAPVIYAPGDTVFLERGTALEAMAPALRAYGHKVGLRAPSFKANAIERVDGRWVGAADPRSEGAAVSE
ncbi:gamma-glutamyltransferase [Sphingomonas arenae]|uniref:gamma-glutamyltransferase n=1 Tax=Sphingomonas arenae TaxID=2812555 RepID=UPI0019684E72|nr:gamma-glutamyltransferase [Sphingomonas arenae]